MVLAHILTKYSNYRNKLFIFILEILSGCPAGLSSVLTLVRHSEC